MNRWIRIVIGLSLICALALTAAWQHFVRAPERTQAHFALLIADVKPALKRDRAAEITGELSIITDMLDTPQPGETQEKKQEREAARERMKQRVAQNEIEKNERLSAAQSEFSAYETRFAELNSAHLQPCERDELYRYWGSLHFWQAWADRQSREADIADSKFAAFEAEAQRYTGRPVSFEDIKAVGDAEFAAVKTQLETLSARVQAEYSQSLDDFAVRETNFSKSAESITARLAPRLAEVEAAFRLSGDFDFADVPVGVIETQQGYGPNFAIASYYKHKNAMTVYYADGRYNHIYDTMLAVHEIMPGHHLQIKMEKSRACGSGPISSRTSMLEGWATYTEFLADERGLLNAPDQRLGWLDYRLMRAMRIWLDTRRVEYGLTEDQAWDIWQEEMPERLYDDFPREWARVTKSRHHLSYILGSQAILQARETLKADLGDAFEGRAFHAALLNAPHQTLSFLAERIAAQMDARAAMDVPANLPDAAAL